MPALRLVLGDQLSRDLPSLRDARPEDVIVMAETRNETTYVRHHKIKIAFVLSAMRHFAMELERDRVNIAYYRLDDDKDGPRTLRSAVRHALADNDCDEVILTEPGEWRLSDDVAHWQAEFGVPVRVLEDDRFLCSHAQFGEWAGGRNNLLMESFYRDMRRRTGLLMRDGAPEGGQWNFDQDNRKRAPRDYRAPPRGGVEPDDITRAVMALVEQRHGNHFGNLDRFDMAVTRAGALAALDSFIEGALPQFGDYQDAMAAGEAFLNHSRLSAYINAGLLDPLEVCRRAEAAYHEDAAPLNAVEGFIRQIIGWREYVRGVYWHAMPGYLESNHLGADGRMPDFYWDPGKTDMACVSEAVAHTRDYAYSHHIQRLMVTGNFALLAGIDPVAVHEWYLAVYADAYEWVEAPNTLGMALYADGGMLATKPYAASGNYINKMSNYCSGCVYDVAQKNGENACPFNYLYWDFLDRNKDELSKLRRLAMPYRTLGKFNQDKLDRIRSDSDRYLRSIGVRD